MSQPTPVLSIQPTFNPQLMMLRIALKAVPGGLFFIVWGGMMFGGILSTMQGNNELVWSNHIITGCACLVLEALALPIWYWWEQQNYQKTIYHFYENEVEYYEGFFNRVRKVMSYKRITEIEVDHGILQQQFQLGSLKLITNASEGASSRPSGIQLVDIQDSDALYQQIKPLVMASA